MAFSAVPRSKKIPRITPLSFAVMDPSISGAHPLRYPFLLRARVAAALRAEAERSALVRWALAAPPFLPPVRDDSLLTDLPRPDPLFLPPWVLLLTVAQARRSASFSDTPRFS